ncbi:MULTISPECIES: tRNA (adenosine(37)-N6)-threonylcarbamoyltransferase complex dimerization subunit type 1 TsaB [Pelosinus]|uniref:Universal protein YeaZ n=1 Tax=Pelosinus fermentans B4 TaxID=1149862 RepID=I8RJ42_9FIRM|nr:MULTISPECIES: tRNA (adenosine(37)-N6)-threonylcarbamoyltransferase complex dimerization subunit type 1 TsaB [Pelosinus]EIW19973.1 universal protein YeaZ [Pelosinus fermentans B4]EIW21170.1 universal protein YeaZ [Pelosinus fermentans A11]OAM95053.1 universal protein YeaZ [Pelosinus fermentans DSM 17108]SDR22593.1 tRNA threonylcarbamoyladenosine biosynthesis protein TsaB [Pelosinus fermentans]
MPILAIDTATLVSSVALATVDNVLAEITLQTKKTHSELLMPHIAKLLDMAQVAKSDLKGVAVSIGPGSFTGLRIGLSTAKTLAYALQIPVVGVPTLAAMAYGCPVPGVILAPMLDAQKGNVYQALFEWHQGELKEIQPAIVTEVTAALESLSQQERPVIVMGESAVMYRDKIEQIGKNLILAAPHVVIQRASSVAGLGYKLIKQGVRHDVMGLEPLYIRRSEAEVLWECRHGVAK